MNVVPSSTARLGPERDGQPMAPEEFDAVVQYDENYRYELIGGSLVVSPIPSEAEADPNEELGLLLRLYQRDHPQGRCLDRTLPERHIHVAGGRRRADRVIWAGLGRRPNPKTDVPQIAVEFVSAGELNAQRDYLDKRKEYRDAGVVEYWLIDRFRREMTVFRFETRRTIEIRIGESETYESPLLPGFRLPLAQLLDVADDWSA